ncbi:hypothetical protein HDF17_002225 [Granulicella arctica]|uniref:Uncharacterized protein n=1 Tax=Granulicella arctica TaxID=940613 RepID=A0A7Y9PHL6_9BACT|nr:hypothetical protein [Granulicella arctica]
MTKRCPEPLRLVCRRNAEEPFEFAAELRGAFVPDPLRCNGGSERVLHHEHSYLVKTNSLEILQGRGVGEGFEVVMQRGKVELSIAVTGGAKLVWFRTFVKVVSNRACSFSVMRNCFATQRLTLAVPGPWRIPTQRPAPAGGCERRKVEILSSRLSRVKVFGHDIRTKHGSTIDNIDIRLIA